ncbi:MAG: ComEA family DNA-binding protein [Candidatus Schekmanbacteria bacterium]|nr:ComEA family DNA-binding protein [Candidatus Schekmanbacteria bacterium]
MIILRFRAHELVLGGILVAVAAAGLAASAVTAVTRYRPTRSVETPALGPALVLTQARDLAPTFAPAAAPGTYEYEPVRRLPPAALERLLERYKIDVNTAALEDLQRLPGIGPGKAKAILEYKQEHGRFRSLDDLDEVPGISQATIERLATHATVR